MAEFYDGKKLLAMKDLNGDTPEIFICTSNRSAGKTVWFSKFCVDGFKELGEKFMILYRYKDELTDCAKKFFKDIQFLFYPEDDMTEKVQMNGSYCELFLNGDSCGYAVAINTADALKRLSHLFSDTKRMFFDEFQSETDHYCPKEMTKFISLHTTVARGGGEQCRYVPVFLVGNPVTLINPYYTALNIGNRLRSDTKFLRGEGWVLEQGHNDSAAVAQSESAFNRAFAQNQYVRYAQQSVYLNDNLAFVGKPNGTGSYLVTLKYGGTEFGVREYTDQGIIYVDDRPDNTFKSKISVTAEDHNINYVMLKRNDMFLANLRYYFEHGCFRFKNLKCKEAIMKALSY